uniref:MRP-L46 domain-containing protein n=1 Tax=Panagrellus redivivus TaxID=6233 RepID=A0A7E4V4I8_PANRE
MLKLGSRLLQAAPGAPAAAASGKYDIFASIAICRSPVVAPELTDIQQKFSAMHAEIEAENAYKSNFELRHEKDLVLIAKRKELEAAGKDLSLLEGEIGVTAAMQEEDWIRRQNSVLETTNATRHAGEENENTKTLSRYFDKKLLLLVQQKFDNSAAKYASPWILPQIKNNGEPLRQTVEKCVGEVFDENVKLTIFGNAPFWHITYKYPKKLIESTKSGTIGGKIFVYQGFIENAKSDPKINSKWIQNYQWATANELTPLLAKSKLYKSPLQHVLYE